MCLSLYLYICLWSIHLSSLYPLSIINFSIHPLNTYLSSLIYLSVYQLSISHLSPHLIYQSSIHLLVKYRSIYQLSISHLSIHVFIYHLSIYQSNTYPSINYLFLIYLSIHVFISLPITYASISLSRNECFSSVSSFALLRPSVKVWRHFWSRLGWVILLACGGWRPQGMLINPARARDTPHQSPPAADVGRVRLRNPDLPLKTCIKHSYFQNIWSVDITASRNVFYRANIYLPYLWIQFSVRSRNVSNQPTSPPNSSQGGMTSSDHKDSSSGKGTLEAANRIFWVHVPLRPSEPPWELTDGETQEAWQEGSLTLVCTWVSGKARFVAGSPQTRLEQMWGLRRAVLLKRACGDVQDPGTSVLSTKLQRSD